MFCAHVERGCELRHFLMNVARGGKDQRFTRTEASAAGALHSVPRKHRVSAGLSPAHFCLISYLLSTNPSGRQAQAAGLWELTCD